MKIAAIIAVRNSEMYVRPCIEHLLKNDIEIIIIDNESTDNTLNEINFFKSNESVKILHEPYEGAYNWARLLALKDKIKNSIDADWIIHHDIDEIMQSTFSNETLHDVISSVSNKGYTAINFDEFVFIPENEEANYSGLDYYSEMSYYYHFAPSQMRLIRAFKNEPRISNVKSGGHRIPLKDIRLYPTNFALRHYIGLSMEQLRIKYSMRVYSKAELAIGWHANRLNIDWDQVKAPEPGLLKKLEMDWKDLDDSDPKMTHFWQW